MLVWLAEHLVKYYSGFNVFSYLTFRAIVSLLTALFISLWMVRPLRSARLPHMGETIADTRKVTLNVSPDHIDNAS